tara:strand:+ start:44 stop:247 length:204 start_codon:yes stop_codon:yes gene_type:complete
MMLVATQSFILQAMKMWSLRSDNTFESASANLKLIPSQRNKDTRARKTSESLLFNYGKITKIICGVL